jgi:Family of unknown function (DUF6507)
VTKYKIWPPGVDHVVKDVGHVVQDDLREDFKKVRDVLDDAIEHIADQACPVRGAVQLLLLGAAGELRGVATATAAVLRAGIRATNAYVHADDLMASEAGAREAASDEVGQLGGLTRRDYDNRRERISVEQWIAQQRQGQVS